MPSVAHNGMNAACSWAGTLVTSVTCAETGSNTGLASLKKAVEPVTGIRTETRSRTGDPLGL